MPDLKSLRESKGWTQQDLSNKAHIAIVTISRAENGKPISRNIIARLCEVLGVEVGSVEGVNYEEQEKAANQ